jgi:hypothetical protein
MIHSINKVQSLDERLKNRACFIQRASWPTAQCGACGTNGTHQECINRQECCHDDSQENNN